jgi:glycerol-3-phosphate dehydrogenase (NAD(P)+)
VSCAKGIDMATGLGPTALIQRHAPGARVAQLTGPSFAVDIAAGLPTALTLACEDDAKQGAMLQQALSTATCASTGRPMSSARNWAAR